MYKYIYIQISNPSPIKWSNCMIRTILIINFQYTLPSLFGPPPPSLLLDWNQLYSGSREQRDPEKTSYKRWSVVDSLLRTWFRNFGPPSIILPEPPMRFCACCLCAPIIEISLPDMKACHRPALLLLCVLRQFTGMARLVWGEHTLDLVERDT